MTLARQLILIVSFLFLLVFEGTFVISVMNTRAYLVSQMESHAQDAATYLGLSLKPAMEKNDVPLMETMVNAVFDRGYYREISVIKPDGSPLIMRRQDMAPGSVPGWFADLVPLKAPRGEALISVGWRQAAKVVTEIHPGYAYARLWKSAAETFAWSVGSFIAAVLLVTLAVRLVLKPLAEVEGQALAICGRKFPVVGKIPWTRELRRVVSAMNKMSAKVERMLTEQAEVAERLRREAYEDIVTDLENRRGFELRLDYFISNREEFAYGALFLVRITDFIRYNNLRGYAEGDELLKEAAAVIRKAVEGYNVVTLARVGGSQFGLIVSGVFAKEAGKLAGALSHELAILRREGLERGVARVGAAFSAGGVTASELLSIADAALREAEAKGPDTWSLREADPGRREGIHGAREWKDIIEKAIAEKRITLRFQKVMGRDGETLHHEALARIVDEAGGLVPAGVFMPVAERFGMAGDMDRMVVELVAQAALREGVGGAKFAVNLSPSSAADAGFTAWLMDFLKERRGVAQKLIFEISEHGAIADIEGTGSLIGGLKELGAGFGLDHFGSAASSFGHLRGLDLSYIKIDGGYIRGIHKDRDNQFYVEAISKIAHGLEMSVIGEFVETEEDWMTLQDLGLDGGQGFFIGPPEEMAG